MAITLTVEDGTGLSNANTFVDKAYVDAFAENMGITSWCNNANMQDVALLQSADFITLRYGQSLRGLLVDEDQSLPFPRMYNGINTGVPEALKKAQAWLAIKFIESGLELDANADAGRVVQSESISLGGGAISESKTYASMNKAIAKNVYARADAYMKQIPCYGSTGVFVTNVRG